MKVLRTILGVIAGYAIFAVSAVLLFQLTGVDAHADASIGFMIFTIAYGIVFSFLGGVAAYLIARTGTLMVNHILATLMAAFAAFSWFSSAGNHYTQIAAVFLFAPASLFGGIYYSRRKTKQ